ncbi:YbgA family protein [Lignipirellula cremea]|uniref:DUF1722 domain-containing protein n=1 Tax=Lignipirellula cremea TaxID=2528010 RepID=A0A518E1E9_9BACT|nr:DUF523 and DUF1722 domain-containing protein [Lignipirellula cremea]QDU97918.1 hypothetical protein Pla8534_57770 [Lignipirellula cremea]
MPPDEQPPLPRVGVSACLLGQKVRYDGQHTRDSFIVETLSPFVEYVPVCPEVEIGLGTPRPAIHLQASNDQIRLQVISTGEDLTEQMQTYAADRTARLRQLGLSGYLLKSRSPSCGMERVKVRQDRGFPVRNGRGLFAAALLDGWPELPVEEEGRLRDTGLRTNFCERLFAYHRLSTLFRSDWTRRQVVELHSREKFLLLAHHETSYRRLGRLVAAVKQTPREKFAQEYLSQFMSGLVQPASFRRHFNVLEHLLGFFRERLDPRQRGEIHDRIEDYRRRVAPLIVPLTLIRHYAEILDIDYLRNQTYLRPYPAELLLPPGSTA